VASFLFNFPIIVDSSLPLHLLHYRIPSIVLTTDLQMKLMNPSQLPNYFHNYWFSSFSSSSTPPHPIPLVPNTDLQTKLMIPSLHLPWSNWWRVSLLWFKQHRCVSLSPHLVLVPLLGSCSGPPPRNVKSAQLLKIKWISTREHPCPRFRGFCPRKTRILECSKLKAPSIDSYLLLLPTVLAETHLLHSPSPPSHSSALAIPGSYRSTFPEFLCCVVLLFTVKLVYCTYTVDCTLHAHYFWHCFLDYVQIRLQEHGKHLRISGHY
jgi:hypothetical protein